MAVRFQYSEEERRMLDAWNEEMDSMVGWMDG